MSHGCEDPLPVLQESAHSKVPWWGEKTVNGRWEFTESCAGGSS
jgi:hypothetical protein